MNYLRRIILIIVLGLLVPSPLFAKSFPSNGPFRARTLNPVYLQSLGQTPDKATVLNKGSVDTWFDFAYTNLFEVGSSGTNELFLDMELARISYNIAAGLGHGMQVSLEVPALHYNGGFLDKFIQDFHKFFGFPNGGREYYPNGMFRYRIVKNGRVLYNVSPLTLGLSDIVLGFKHNFIEETKSMPAFSWRFKFKFPTGNRHTGSGSGNPDFSLGFVMEKSISRWHFFLNLDYIVVSGNDYFAELYNHEMLAWATTVELSVSKPISVLVQLQGSTNQLSAMHIEAWDGVPVDLVVGVKGTHKKLIWGHDFFWRWDFTEDIYPDGASVDISTALLFGIRF